MASAPRPAIPPSIPAGPALLSGAVELLSRIDALPAGATGMLRFGVHGMALVQDRCVCWAAATTMEKRLTEVLLAEFDPSFERERLVALYQRCKQQRTSLVDALLETGKVTTAGLRRALFSHTAEAVAHLALYGAHQHEFIPHVRARYDERFRFSPGELLARLGARNHPEPARAALAALGSCLVADSGGWAFLRDQGTTLPTVIASVGLAFPIPEMLQACLWSGTVFDLASGFDAETSIGAASWAKTRSAVTWRRSGVCFVALCANRAAGARLVATLESQLPLGTQGS